jgi:hypothetical protein
MRGSNMQRIASLCLTDCQPLCSSRSYAYALPGIVTAYGSQGRGRESLEQAASGVSVSWPGPAMRTRG